MLIMQLASFIRRTQPRLIEPRHGTCSAETLPAKCQSIVQYYFYHSVIFDVLYNVMHRPTSGSREGRPVSEHKLLWQPSDCIINFVLLTLLLHVGNKYDDDDDDEVQGVRTPFLVSE